MDFVLIICHLNLVVSPTMIEWIVLFRMKLICSEGVEEIELIIT
jgi:hypothetical protein